MQFSRGRLFDHVHLVVADLAASRRFYEAILAVIGVPIQTANDRHFQADELFVSTGSPLTGRVHIAFQAQDRAMVDAAYRAGLAAGGRDNGAPGERAYPPGYYGAYLLDPDGNNVEAVFHGEATRNVEAVIVTPKM